MEESAEWELEKELEQHTQEQRESLVAIDEALAADPSNEELLMMKDELGAAVKAAEHSLLELKKARLLQEVDALTDAIEHSSRSALPGEIPGRVEFVEIDEDERESEQQQVPSFPVLSKCRFRHTNGRWYSGEVIALEDFDVARISFLFPTAENMQICRFYLQQRCRFGGSCRQSHGMEFPLHALQQFVPPQWQNVPLGSTILAYNPKGGFGLWSQAELESLDEANQRAGVVFISDGRRADLEFGQLAISEPAESSDSSGTSSGEEEDGDDFDVLEDDSVGVLQAGPVTETVAFAKWEKHTRGVASKMMAGMGFREGMGLGKSGQGQLAPIEVKVLPPKQSLGYVSKKDRATSDSATGNGNEAKGVSKKKTRGGRRKRQKKWAAAAFAGKLEQDRRQDVFGFINQQLAGQSDVQSKLASSRTRDHGEQHVRNQGVNGRRAPKEDRRTIVAHEDEMMELRSKIGKLEDMAKRNQKEKAVFDSVSRKLQEAKKALSAAEAAHASASDAVHSKEKEKKWLRF